MSSVTRFLCQKLISLIQAFSSYLLWLWLFIPAHILRLQTDVGDSLKSNETEPESIKEEPESKKTEPELSAGDDATELIDTEERQELYLRFKFPTFEEFSKFQKGTGDLINSEVVHSATGEISTSTFVREPEILTFPVKEINADEISNFSENEEGLCVGNSEKGKGILGCDEGSNQRSQFTEESVEKAKTEHQEDQEFLEESPEFSPGDDSTMDSFSDSEPTSFLSEVEFEGESWGFEESEDFDDQESDDVMEELNNSENPDGFLSERDFFKDSSKIDDANFVGRDDENGGDDLSENLASSDANKLESLWEHQELIDQLKIELRKVRATGGLPTILEESESPKIMDDLKPWKIDEKFHREDCLGELHKFYKSYRERMRKFDILNYQKTYAMGFLQLKDPLQSMSKQEPPAPTLRTLVSQNLWLFKHKIHGTDPIKKFIKELQGDFEVVYVGHMCLSWEFLHWQYEKALDLWDTDPRGIRRYNEVAGEFQQFQVLMQRFIEDEPFQGRPRVENYVKGRCALRGLLQVPVMRVDNLRDKRKARIKGTDEYVITSDMLVEILEESIRIFWRFVRADKDCTTAALCGRKKMPELQNPDDLKLFSEVTRVLEKKERKVKDLLRSENCIVRKLQRCREDDDSDQVLYFFSQVDMKLVSRVLNMSKITRDQLIWCSNKLSRISFVNRKIDVEPAFLLFPC